jgi:hypothetical protein
MFKKLAMAAICALAVGTAVAGPTKPGETAANPLILSIGTSLAADWNPNGEAVWTLADWIHINNLTKLYVKVLATTTFDFGITPPNNGQVQDFDFDLLINGSSVSQTNPSGFVAYWDNVTLTGGQVYDFQLNSFNEHDNNTVINFSLLAGNANVPTDPDTPTSVPEPASLGLLGLGLLGLGVARRRRHKISR